MRLQRLSAWLTPSVVIVAEPFTPYSRPKIATLSVLVAMKRVSAGKHIDNRSLNMFYYCQMIEQLPASA